MKKMLWITVLVLALSTGVVGTAFAAENEAPPGPGDGQGPLHEQMIEAAAGLLGLTPSDVEARLAEGETVVQIAVDLGLDAQAFRSDWMEARRAVIESAIDDGLILRFQVRRMLGLHGQFGDRGCGGRASPEASTPSD
jgi:hypothetical protein